MPIRESAKATLTFRTARFAKRLWIQSRFHGEWSHPLLDEEWNWEFGKGGFNNFDDFPTTHRAAAVAAVARLEGELHHRRDKATAEDRARLQAAFDDIHAWLPPEPSTPSPTPDPKAKPTASAPKPAAPSLKPLSQISAAAKILATSPEPLNCPTLIALMHSTGLWTSPGGKTPAAPHSAAIHREIMLKGPESRFAKAGKGAFALSTRKRLGIELQYGGSLPLQLDEASQSTANCKNRDLAARMV